MADNTQRLIASIEARYSKAERDMKKFVTLTKTKMKEAEKASADAAKRAEAAHTQAFGRMTSGLKGFIGAYLSIRGIQILGGFVSDALHAAAAVKDLANAAGVSTKYLQEMNYAAGQNGASAELFSEALAKLNKNLGDFRNTGAGPAAETLKQLGLATRVMSGELSNAEDAMDAALEALANVPVAADRAALAADLFGKAAGPKMAEMMKTGASGIKAAREEAERLGLVLSDDMINSADEATDKLDALWSTLKTAGVRAIGENAEAIKNFADYITEHIPEIISWFQRLAGAIHEIGVELGLVDRTAAEHLKNRLDALHTMRDSAEKSPFGGILNIGSGEDMPGSGFYSKEDIQRQIDAVVAQLDALSRNNAANDGWDGSVTVTGQRRRHAGTGTDPEAAAAMKTAEALAKKWADVVTARHDALWGPEARGRDKASLEDASRRSTAGMEARDIDPMKAVAESTARAREAWQGMFGQFISDLRGGDIQSAFTNLFQNITSRMIERATDQLANIVFDAIGPETMRGLLDPADAAQGAFALTTQTADFSLQAMTQATTAATIALQQMAAQAAGGGGNPWLRLLGAVLGAVGGGNATFTAGNTGGGGGWASGGFTGAGGVNEVAGAVHKGEYVMDAAATRRIGIPQLEAIRRGGGGGGSSTVLNVVINNPTRDSIPGIQAVLAQHAKRLNGMKGEIGDGLRRNQIAR